MISKDQNIALLTVANLAKANSDWSDYTEYCLYREKGLRKHAFKKLDSFIKSTNSWTFDEKINFIKFLFPLFETVEEADYGAFPQPLSERFIKPVLKEWCEIENEDGRPFRWYGKYYRCEGHIYRALEINPKDDIARHTLLSRWTYSVYYSIHHLPEGYIGNYEEDLRLIAKIRECIFQLSDKKSQENWLNEIEEDVEIVMNYRDWKESGHPDLEKWAKENNRQVGYKMSRTYYYKK